MEQELDLRPYALATLRRWRWILGGMLVAFALAAGWTLLQPPTFRASTSVLIDPFVAMVSLEGRITERDTGPFTTAASRRQALLDLLESPVLEARVLERLGSSEWQPGDLVRRVQVRATNTDLLQVTVTGRDEAEAVRLAELWGQEYERLVRELYSDTTFGVERLDQEIAEARERYAEARRKLEEFVQRGELTRTSYEAARLRELLDAARTAHRDLYAAAVERVRELEQAIADARTLRMQVERGERAPADAISAIVLRLRASGDGGINLMVDPDILARVDPDLLAASRAATLDELERLIAVLEGERDRMLGEAERIAAAIAAGDASAVALDPDTLARYERELARLDGRLADLSAEQKALQQAVDLALNTLEALQTKRDERALAQATPTVSVRYLGTTPVGRSVISLLLRNGAIAAVLASVAIIVVIVGQEIARQVRGAPTPAGQPAPGRSAASD